MNSEMQNLDMAWQILFNATLKLAHGPQAISNIVFHAQQYIDSQIAQALHEEWQKSGITALPEDWQLHKAIKGRRS